MINAMDDAAVHSSNSCLARDKLNINRVIRFKSMLHQWLQEWKFVIFLESRIINIGEILTKINKD